MEPLVGLRQSESRTVLKVRGPAAATALTADWCSNTEVRLGRSTCEFIHGRSG